MRASFVFHLETKVLISIKDIKFIHNLSQIKIDKSNGSSVSVIL